MLLVNMFTKGLTSGALHIYHSYFFHLPAPSPISSCKMPPDVTVAFCILG